MIDPGITLLSGELSTRFKKMKGLCSEFKIVHHCNWKNYTKSCSTHVREYLKIMNHSCHHLFGK